jgi:DNA-binding HxlR family transcriptional regulator
VEEGTSKSPWQCDGTPDDPRQWDTRSDCEVRQVLDRVSDKWSLLVLGYLSERSHRFAELRRRVVVSQRMLTVTLRQLERDGLVLRTAHPVVPPRVDYELTALGESLHSTVRVLSQWADVHREEIGEARTAFDARSGNPTQPESRAGVFRGVGSGSAGTFGVDRAEGAA